MKLSVLDRIVLGSIMPVRGDFLTLDVSGRIRKKLAFSDQERDALGIVAQPDGRVAWKPNVVEEAEIPLEGSEEALIAKVLIEAEKEKTLTLDLMPVYRKVVLKERPDAPLRDS